MHSPVRLVAIDMDGTLLPTPAHAISARNARAMRATQAAGITLAIATGRRTDYAMPMLKSVGLRADTPMITSNGAVLSTYTGETFECRTMEARVARGLCGLLRPFGTMVFTFDRTGRGALVYEDLSVPDEQTNLWLEANRDALQKVKPLELALSDGNDPIQGMVAGNMAKMKRAMELFRASEWATQCSCALTENPSRDMAIMDLLPIGVTKGAGLERLAARLGVDRKETMAIGDNWNDLDMLEWAGQSVLMANAPTKLRALARTNGWKQTPPCDEDGVAVALEAMLAKTNFLSA
jgi:hypothetical protein